MPHFTRRIDRGGPTINVLLTVSAARFSALEKNGKKAPKPIVANGLIDTGASSTCIDQDVIQRLGLISTGQTHVHTPSTRDGPVLTDEYDCGLLIYARTTENPYAVPNLPVIEAPLLEMQGIHTLIGRDVLSKCILIYDGVMNTYTLAF
ncbi:MAG: hypothetical protein F4053_17475 [Proteobacteria bacterium]|nr:hypothetical protein [Pseudomonadota bacterium]MYJ97297.1 hypothetical protein [Pseudomonadota bacterium]